MIHSRDSTVETIPLAGLALLLGVDIFMSEIRSVTNLIGNGVATLVISKWENALDYKKAIKTLEGETEMQADEPEEVADEAFEEDISSKDKPSELLD